MRIGRLAGGLAGVAAATLIVSAMYQAAAEARDRRSSPPGRLVDVDGCRLHIRCAGQGTPSVVVIPALGASSESWLGVQQQVAAHTTACVYDRAGLGWSGPLRKRPTAAGMARELHALLHSAPVTPPYVLAGHSMGGLIARVFAHLYPDEIAGLALIDSSHPSQPERLPRVWMRDYPGGKLLTVALEWARPLGLRRLAWDLGLPCAGNPGWSRHRRADAAELLAFDAVCHETGRIAGDLGDLPLAVVTSSALDPNDPPGSPHQQARSRFYPSWMALQAELASLSSDTVHAVADASGHYIHRDDPELVSAVLVDLVSRARR